MNKTENISSQQELLEVKKQLPVEIYQCIESTKEIGAKISRTGGTLDFGNIIQFIDHILDTKPVEFTNGEVQNAAGENTGSLKILAFGKMM